MSYVSDYLPHAAPVNRWTIQARAERLRGEVMRQMASALGRRIASAFSGLAGRRTAGHAV